MQRSSSFLSRKPASRSGSLLGLQGPPADFQQPQPQQRAPQRSQSLTAGSAYNKRLSTKKSTSSLTSGPRMIKKHIPGPYGLVTIEVPADTEQKPKVKPKGSQSFTRFSDKGSLRSFQSAGSHTSSVRVKRAIINEPLKEVDEDIPEDFDQPEPVFTNETNQSPKALATPNLAQVQEEEAISKNLDGGLVELKLEKDNEELELQNKLKLEQETEQNALSAKLESPEDYAQPSPSPVPTEIKDIKKTIVSTEPTLNPDGTVAEPHGLDAENEVLDEYTDAPSTAKSNDTATAGQSSYTTVESESEQEQQTSSMAQQLRPTIPSLQVNNNRVRSNSSQEGGAPPAANRLSNTISGDTAASSLYSTEYQDIDEVISHPTKSISNESSQDLQIPARSTKRGSSTSPRKSALKIKSNSTVSLNENTSNPANAAYLSLTTAENTRLNALSSSNLPATNLSRSNSSRHSLRQEPANNNNIKTTMRAQPQANGPRTSLRQNPPQPQQQQNSKGLVQKRPQSVAASKPDQNGNRPNRPASSQGFRPQSQATAPASSRFSRPQPPPQQVQQQSPSNAAALNATLKKSEPPKPLVRSSSFEKERPAESHAAFKRKSLRDPQLNNHANVESQLGFYRHQAAQQNHHEQQQQQQAHSHETNGHAFAGFRSRFDDSDSDSEAVPTLRKNTKSNKNKLEHDFAPPPNNPTLRKPKSQFTLRSASNSAVPENGSPAKSLPEKRNTRYFSETDKEQLFNEHLKKTEAALHGEKKKGKFGSKLKKIFGRGN